MAPDIEATQATTSVEPAVQGWTTPEIVSFDAVTITESTGIFLGDFLNSLS